MALDTIDWQEWPIMNIADLSDPGARGFGVGGGGEGEWPFRGIIVLRNGEVHAYANVCPHARHPLDMLPDDFLVENGSLLRCASHGALFVPETGECIAGPCTGMNLIELECRQDDNGQVFVRAPDRMQAVNWGRAW